MKERDIAGLESKLGQLEQVRDQQAGQIESLQASRQQLNEQSGEATSTVHQLSDQLNRLKYTFDDVTRKQRQVLSTH